MTTQTNPSVYVGTYAKYSNGSIKGAWLDLTNYSDFDDFIEACKELHSDESEPELMFQDFENFPKEFYSESSLDPMLFDWLSLDDDEREKVKAFIDCFGITNNVIEDANNAFYGQFDSDLDLAYEVVENYYNLEEPLASYFDYDKFARDLMYDFSSSNGFYFSKNW